MKIGIHALATGLITVAAISVATVSAPSAFAQQTRSQFDPIEIEAAIAELTEAWDHPELSGADREELALGIGQLIAPLSAESFNDLVAHLAADYRQNPGHRDAIESILSATRSAAGHEIEEYGWQSGLLTIVNDTIAIWTAVRAFRFGRGLWMTRGQGLGQSRSFTEIAHQVAANVPRERLRTLALAGSAGVIHAVTLSLEQRKLDPLRTLARVQLSCVEDLTARATQLRSRIENGETGESVEAELRSIEDEARNLLLAAPELRSRMRAVEIELGRSHARLAQRSS